MVKVSIIVPVYNVEKYLEKCLDSVINQTFEDIEVICINDGSTDNSLKILNKYVKKDKRVKVFSIDNNGLGNARNLGMKKAKGNYMFFLDSDDYIHEETIEKLYNNAVNNNSDLTFFKLAKFSDEGKINYDYSCYLFEKIFKNVNFNNFYFTYHGIKHYVLNQSFSACTKLYKRKFLEEHKFLFPKGIIFEDVLFHVQVLIKAKRMSYFPEYFYFYRDNPSSIMNMGKNYSDIMTVCDDVEKFLKDEKLYDSFLGEFVYFKIRQIMNYIESSKSEELFAYAKNYFAKIKERYLENPYFNLNLIPQHLIDNSILITESETLESYYLRLKLKDKDTEINMLNKKINNINSEKNNLISEIEKLQNEKVEINTQKDEIVALKEEILVDKNLIAEENKSLISKENNYKNEIIKLNKNIEEINAENQKNINKLNANIDNYQNEIQSLTNKMIQDNISHERENNLLNNKIQEISMEKNQVIEDNKKLNEDIILLKEELKQVNINKNELNDQLDKLILNNSELNDFNKELSRLSDENNQKLMDIINDFDEYKNQVNNLVNKENEKLFNNNFDVENINSSEDILTKLQIFFNNIEFINENQEFEKNQLKNLLVKKDEIISENETKINELTSLNNDFNQLLKNNKNEIDDLKRTKSEYVKFKEEVYHSTSWKLTEPLRKIKR